MNYYITGIRRGLGQSLWEEHGSVEKLEDCDIFVNLSVIEGWNISLLDSYLNKKIIFTTKVGCVNEILLKNKNVIICDKKNDEKTSQKLKKLILENKIFDIDNRYFEILNILNDKKLNQDYFNLVK